MKNIVEPVRPPSSDDSIGPVTILDAQGHVVRVVAAAEFRSTRRGSALLGARRRSAPGEVATDVK